MSPVRIASLFAEIGVKTDQLKSGLGQAKTSLQGTQKALRDITGQIPGLQGALNLLSNPLVLAGAGIAAFGTFAFKATKETVEYNKQVREMSVALGISAEETSRIIQVSDDWGISIGEVRQSLSLMAKNGIDPTVDNLANLADEFVASGGGAEFAEKASKLLGRSWQTLIPILQKGGKSLRDQADAVDESLIATDKNIAASREFEVAMDALGDTVTGLARTFGNELIPELTKGLKLVNEFANDSVAFERTQDALREAVRQGTITQKESNDVMWKVRWNKMSDAEATEFLKKKYDILWGSVDRTTDAGERHAEMMLQQAIPATDKLKLAEEELILAQKELNQQMSDLDNLINGRLGPEIENFTEDQEKLREKMGEVQAKIDKLNGMEYLTDEQGAELDDLHGDMKTLSDEYTASADSHDEATKRILLDLIIQRASVDGLTKDETTMIENLAGKWGLIDKATLAATVAADQAMQNLANGVGVTQTQLVLETQLGTLSAIQSVVDYLSGKTFNYTVQGEYMISGIPVGPGVGPYIPPETGTRQHGGMVYPGMRYTVGEAGPETLVMGQSGGYVIPNSGSGGQRPINITIQGNVERDNIYTLARAVGAELNRQSRYN